RRRSLDHGRRPVLLLAVHAVWTRAYSPNRVGRLDLRPEADNPPANIEGGGGIRPPHLMRFRAFRPQVTKSSDGKIWFVNGDKASFIDTSHIGINTLPPSVHIEQITANGKTYDVARGLRLPPLV